MNNFCISSETYNIELADIIALNDADLPYESKGKVVVLLRRNQPDSLLSGRKILEKAKKENKKYISVRIAFVSEICAYNFFCIFIRPLRKKYQYWSSNIYHMNPAEIRKMKIERSFRSKENAYTFTNPLYRRTDEERMARYEKLYNSMENGYDDTYPIEIMLLRMMGVKDTVNNGHHRLGIALECGLDRVAINFKVIGQAPRILKPVFKFCANLTMKFKQSRKN
ncbi:MAG: hypothetical protein J6Y53_05300 [Alphaproteobacteria bacterium]|nr:hypothetical protein [Alphaproteobacteria bacterium]